MFFGRPAACSDDIWNYNSAGKVHLHLRNIEAFERDSCISSHNKGYQPDDQNGVDGADTAVSCTRRFNVCALWTCAHTEEA